MGYRYQVNFEKKYVSGKLSGRRYTCEFLRFADWKSADEFREKCDGLTACTDCTGLGAYVREYPILTAIEPM